MSDWFLVVFNFLVVLSGFQWFQRSLVVLSGLLWSLVETRPYARKQGRDYADSCRCTVTHALHEIAEDWDALFDYDVIKRENETVRAKRGLHEEVEALFCGRLKFS